MRVLTRKQRCAMGALANAIEHERVAQPVLVEDYKRVLPPHPGDPRRAPEAVR